jgi:hypothetical protein
VDTSKLRLLLATLTLGLCVAASSLYAFGEAPVPLLEQGKPVDWWLVFKLGSGPKFRGCTPAATAVACPFGGKDQTKNKPVGQQYIFASSSASTLQKGDGCAGQSTSDPIGATFGEVYDKPHFYVVWNDQFYGAPAVKGCGKNCNSPWAHSKGMLAWDESGEGFVMQVSTPSWPGSGSRDNPRKRDGNTLGCVATTNNLKFSQHFFALRLAKDDVVTVLTALQNASIGTDPADPELVSNGGPEDIQRLVEELGTKSDSMTVFTAKLSSGVGLISKPSKLHVPPWQMVSAMLGGTSLRTATWWTNNKIYTTPASKKIACWDSALQQAGRVEIVKSGEWDHVPFSLVGGANHAKMAVSISNGKNYAIFGDMNQEGALSGKCGTAQNGRGGLFFVVENEALTTALTSLMDGDIAPTAAPPK